MDLLAIQNASTANVEFAKNPKIGNSLMYFMQGSSQKKAPWKA